MIESPKHDFITTELDPDILSTPIEVQTNWHVITGAPCSGKTTLIDKLADKGFQTVSETARLYIEKEIAKGRKIDDIRGDVDALERSLIEIQLRFERALRKTDIAFLDRGLPDCLTYCRVAEMNPNEILSECFCHRYASIFVLERLPIQQDDIRIEDEATAVFLDEWLVRDYSALGYSVVKVPVLSPNDRLEFVLEKINE
jgi:predicted ATPase